MASFESSCVPTARDFLKLSRKHSLVPVYRTVTADLETPVSAFLRIASEEPEAFLLESVEGGEHVGRYTFIGVEPYKKMVARGRRITVREGRREFEFDGDVFEELKKALSGHTPARLAGLPPFTAGAVGFFAYDVVRQIEKLPSLAKDELGVPDACLMFFDQVLAFDHVKKEIHLMVTADLAREGRGGLRAGGTAAEEARKATGWGFACSAEEEGFGEVEVFRADAKGGVFEGGGGDQRVHRRGGHLSMCAFAAVRLRAGSGCVRDLSGSPHCESLPLYVFFAVWAGGGQGQGPGLRAQDSGLGAVGRDLCRTILWGLRRSCW